MSAFPEYPCGKRRFVQLIEKLMSEKIISGSEIGVDGERLENSEVWRETVVDVSTIRKGKHCGVYGKPMNYFIDPQTGSGGYDYCRKLEKGSAGSGNSSLRCYTSVMYVDIKGFKPYNDYLSESVGDEILAFFAAHLNNFWGGKGYMTVRKGGEEFSLYKMKPCDTWPCYKKNMKVTWAECSEHREDNDEPWVEDYEESVKELMNSRLDIYVPQNEGGSICLGANVAEPPDEKYYKFMYSIQGLSYRYGRGNTVQGAWADAQKRKSMENDKTTRGEFCNDVKVIVGKDKTFPLAEYIVLVTNNESERLYQSNNPNGGNSLAESIRNILENCFDVEIVHEEQKDAKFIVIKRNFSDELTRKEEIDKACGLIRDDMTLYKSLDNIYRLSGENLSIKR